MCMIDDVDGACQFYNEEKPVARKIHIWLECRRYIQPGESYRLVRGVWEGAWHTWKSCFHCGVVEDWLTSQCGGFVHASVLEDVHEHFREYGTLSVGKLAVRIDPKFPPF